MAEQHGADGTSTSKSWFSGWFSRGKGGTAIAIADGKGAKAHAVSGGGYAESVAIGNGAQSSAFANWGTVDIDRTVVGANGQPCNSHFTSPY